MSEREGKLTSDNELIEWLKYHHHALSSSLGIMISQEPFLVQDPKKPENVCAWETFGVVMRKLCECLKEGESYNAAFGRGTFGSCEEDIAAFERKIEERIGNSDRFEETPFHDGYAFFSRYFAHARKGDRDFLRELKPKYVVLAKGLRDSLLPELIKKLSEGEVLKGVRVVLTEENFNAPNGVAYWVGGVDRA